jgi:hypothetical protein
MRPADRNISSPAYEAARAACAASTAEYSAARGSGAAKDWNDFHERRGAAVAAFDAAARTLAVRASIAGRVRVADLKVGDVIVERWGGRPRLSVIARVVVDASRDKRGTWSRVKMESDFPAGVDGDVFAWSRNLRPDTAVDLVQHAAPADERAFADRGAAAVQAVAS